jgi:FkbM family methyltransferase
MELSISTQYRLGGVEFDFVDPDGSVPAETIPGAQYEPGVVVMLKALLGGSSHSFVDVGAHYGFFSVLAGRLNPGCVIHAFEPGAGHGVVYRENMARNGVRSVLHAVALSDHSGRVPFLGKAIQAGGKADADLVRCEPFDAYGPAFGIRPDVVKIDVHGAEGKVISGMKQALRYRVRHVLVELHARHLLIDSTHWQIVEALREADLLVYEVVRFRHEAEPRLQLLAGAAYEAVVDPRLWSEEQVKHERLLYATRR